MTAVWVVLGVVAWLLAALALALIVGRAIRLADEQAAEVPPIPARLDPRAGQHAQRAAHTTFTTLLALVALVGLGLAGAADFAAAGGVQ